MILRGKSFVLFLCAVGTSYAQEWRGGELQPYEPQSYYVAPPVPLAGDRDVSRPQDRVGGVPARQRYFVSAAAGVQYDTFSEGDRGSLWGGHITFGGFTYARSKFWRDLTIAVDVGYWSGWYRSSVFSERYPYNGELDYPGAQEHGVIYRRNDQTNLPVTLLVAYNISWERVNLRLGLAGGATYVSLKSKFTGENKIYDAAGTLVDETPEYDITTKKSSDVLFTIGGFAGMTANVTEHFSIDLSYRFTTTPNVKVGYLSDMGTMLSHQLTVGAVWRW